MSVYGSYVGSQPLRPKVERPGLVTLLAVLSGISVVAGLVGVFMLTTDPDPLLRVVAARPPWGIPALASAPFLIASALVSTTVNAVICVGFFRAWRASWTIALVWSAYSIVAGAESLIAGRAGAMALIGIAIQGAVAYYLMRPEVKAYFRVASISRHQ